MIINTYDPSVLHDAFGIEMSGIDGIEGLQGSGAGWGRVAPGVSSQLHRHDETEFFVIVAGSGEFIVGDQHHPATPGTVALFEPFETHVLHNTGESDLLFVTQYWRDAERALEASRRAERGGFADRPVFVFSTPPTPNGDLHLGHLSGPYLGADAFVRYQRMNGTQAWHLTGSDDFQSYVVGAADRDGRTPAETAAHYSAEIAATLQLMDIPLDQYTVTNEDASYPAGLQAFFSRLVESGRVALQEGAALFDGESGDYLYEVDVKGGCPTCSHATSGNICEECGEPNSVVDLVQPRSNRSDAEPRTGSAERYTLPLHEFAPAIAAHHRLGRVPARLRELAMRLFRRPSLDISVSHPSGWGVRPAEDAGEGQVIWVWPEMSYGFLHGIEALGRRTGQDWRAAAPQPDWKIVHFFGYDNSFYHAILYPALYQLAFPDWAPDIDYHVNEFYLLEGSKFSTSRRHAVWGKEILNPQSVDSVRYFLSLTRPEGRRTNFGRAEYREVLEQTLVGGWQGWLNDLGARVAKNYAGQAPDAGNWTAEHTAFLARLGSRLDALTNSLGRDGFSLNRAAAELNGIVEDTVRFAAAESPLAEAEGWRDEARTATALELAAARLLAHGAAPVMPRFAAKLAAALGLPAPARWPSTPELLTPGSRVDLADQVFFGAPAQAESPEAPALLGWLTDLVASTLQAPPAPADATLLELGASSLQSVLLQYQLLEQLDVDILVDELLGEHDLAALAALLEQRAEPAAVSAVLSAASSVAIGVAA
ncbi:methionyl-tRNA synthetase [Kitasatospora sp. MAP12-15]|uniref:class I tRNA ligase family protein n=1 Tax=unclassified Kitasatospora TaxID=2633591 RepID=UPI00247716F3|nr:class I tRNA ligase family protein [Kitasatospora sp. MAP12-44]MDH6110351.1 methionyl-tRNA synthetase [Kitasatospora sp. MAP12-44]